MQVCANTICCVMRKALCLFRFVSFVDGPTNITKMRAVCHGPSAFNHVKLSNGDFLAKGKKARFAQAASVA